MKKNCLFLLLALVPLALLSCNGRNDNNQLKRNSQKIAGTWNMNFTHIIKYINGKRVKEKNSTFKSGEYSKITFKSNKTYIATSFTDGHKIIETGTYSLKNGKLTTKPSSTASKSRIFPYLPSMNCQIEGNKMVLSIKGSNTVNGQQQEFNMKVRLQRDGSN